MSDANPILVVIRNPEGQYLTRAQKGWAFTRERARAVVFDYKADNVAEYLNLIRKANGPALEAVTAGPEEIYETCDSCHHMVRTLEAFFDGNVILCAACRRAAGASSRT